MPKVIGVRFPSSGRIYYFDPAEFDVHMGDSVIVETARGQEYGFVAQDVTEVEDTMIVSPLKPVLRIATNQDSAMRAENSGKEADAFAICQKKIAQHGLDMKLVDVEYSFNGSKVVFYFTADERVDFRELVKDLASQFRTRIELRQIGVRDEAKMLGGLGSCGRPVCCKTFLDDFRPVSIKMAKEQNLSLSPTKISGLCGRLMCCLQYEQAAYEEMKKKMPRTGRDVLTPDGIGMAVENNAVTEKTRVRLTMPDGSVEMREYHYTQLARPGEPLPPQPAAAVAEPAAERRAPFAQQRSQRPMQQRRPAMPAQEATTAAPATEESGDGKPQGQNKRRRRGGRGHGGNRNPESAAGTGANEASTRNPQGGNRAEQRPAGNAQGERQTGENGAAPNPNRKRRHRGGANRRRPGGQQNGGAAPTNGNPSEHA